MKLSHLLAVILIGIAGWLVWTSFPGLRTSVSNRVDAVGGWTEEARRTDPVGFIEHAEAQLAADLGEFERSLGRLAEARANALTEKERNEKLSAAADELAERFRARFRVAELAGTWPVEFEGATYGREDFVEQVENILSEGKTCERVIGIYDEIAVTVEQRTRDLRERIRETEAMRVELKARKELVRIDKLTAEADELLAQVDSLLGTNEELLTGDSPVRSVEALLAASRAGEAVKTTEADALEFLGKD